MGLEGVYGSASSTTARPGLAPGIAGDICPFDTWAKGCVGVGAGLSGVDPVENFELRLFIHDDFLDPDRLVRSVLGLFSKLGRFDCCLLLKDCDGVE